MDLVDIFQSGLKKRREPNESLCLHPVNHKSLNLSSG
jgi:hypothetical protein